MPPNTSTAPRKGEHVRSLERGLALLKAMNANPQASVTHLAREIGVPRSTAYRLLDTLVALGFVTPSSSIDRYSLTREVYSLSRGFMDEQWIEDAWAEMVALTNRVIWPVDLLTLEGTTMVVRRSTHPRSSLSIDYGMVGRHWPIAESSAGRAYLAFCPVAERDLLLASCKSNTLERGMSNWSLEQTRKHGLGVRVGGVAPKTGSISAPVCIDNTVICCVSIIWIASALSLERALEELGPALKETAERIVQIASKSLGSGQNEQISRA